MRDKGNQDDNTFALTADVSEGHQQAPIHPSDSDLVGCQVQPAEVYVKTVSSFSEASASYYWSCVASAIGRLSQYLARCSARAWHVLVADDKHLKAGGPQCHHALFVLLRPSFLGWGPLAWNKTFGGDTLVWVGFENLHRQLGIPQRFAEWFTWRGPGACRSWGPVHRFLTMHLGTLVRRVPSYVSFILCYVRLDVEMQARCDVTSAISCLTTGGTHRIGSWCATLDKNGNIDVWASPWFSLEIVQESWPWVIEEEAQPFLVI